MALVVLAGTLAVAPASASAATERARITWDTPNDVDLHVYDGDGNHAFFGDPAGIPDATLSGDVTDAGGPEIFTDNRVPSTRSFGYQVCYFSDELQPGPTTVAMTFSDPDGTAHESSFTLETPGQCQDAGDASLLPDGDADRDGALNSADNCFSVPNADQADADFDGIGDACEPDSDADGVIDDTDNCVDVANSGQADADRDGVGDACEPDTDGDGVIDDTDNCPAAANADQADADGDGVGNACDTSPPVTKVDPAPQQQVAAGTAQSPAPVLGQTVVAGKVGAGTVRIKGRDGKFRTLGANESIPLGSEIDATKGRVRLTSAAGPGGKVQTADFYKGAFIVTQTKGSKPITQLKLSAKLSCPAAGKRVRAKPSARRRTVRRLWGDGKGRFRTRGRNAAATVRGTKWLTEDRCDRTKITVKRGKVLVRDFVKKKNKLVKQGQSYVARIPAKKK